MESRGRTTSNRPRKELIDKLMELDQTAAIAKPIVPNTGEDEILWSIRLRLALYGPNPKTELINQVFIAVREEDLEEREKGNISCG
ncbi:Hypothetical predicted protein [Pelobates cultripes]|uniref:Uncharacterized protein n=1 Tax=Pelobates cultripes TaxID=61616 RepID=A0AAD1RKM8_PELCU|nr:Hypothetical predicted protein [Pelobates cultripes]